MYSNLFPYTFFECFTKNNGRLQNDVVLSALLLVADVLTLNIVQKMVIYFSYYIPRQKNILVSSSCAAAATYFKLLLFIMKKGK